MQSTQRVTKVGKAQRFIALLLSLVMLCWLIPAAAIPSIAKADNTPAIPSGYTGYAISSAVELQAFAAQVNNGKNFSTYYVYLADDIDISRLEWTPIGKSTSLAQNPYKFEGSPFSGIFDGCGHVVSGMKINAEPSGNFDESYGLFGFTQDATIKNVGVQGKISSTSTNAAYYGGLVGALMVTIDDEGVCTGNTLVDSCWANVDISIGTAGSASGLVGWNGSGQSNDANLLDQHCTISNSYARGTLSTTSTSDRGPYLYGIACGGGKVMNCYFAGKLCSDVAANSGKHAGVGQSCGALTVENCWHKSKAFFAQDGTTTSEAWQNDKFTAIGSSAFNAATLKGASWSDAAGWSDADGTYPGLVYSSGIAHAITVDSVIAGGTVTVDKTEAVYGETVTVTVAPAENYRINSVTCNSKAIAPVAGVYSFIMPDENVTVSAAFAREYNVNVATGLVGGTLSASVTKAAAGDEVTITGDPGTGYHLGAVKVNDVGQTLDGNSCTFTMPSQDVNVTGNFSKTKYNIYLPSAQTGGSVTASAEQAYYGDKVTLTPSPEAGYELASLSVEDKDGAQVDIVDGNSFTMPASSVTVKAVFQKTYSVDVDDIQGGTVAVDKENAICGDTVTITVEPGKNVYLDEADLVVANGDDTEFFDVEQVMNEDGTPTNKFTFEMPASDVTVCARFVKTISSISMKSWVYGQEAAEPELDSESRGEVTYNYFTADGQALASKPSKAGSYLVGASIDKLYEDGVLFGPATVEPCEFKIENAAQKLSGTVDAVSVTAGKQAGYQLNITSDAVAAKASYASSNEKVATVDANGKVTFTGVGAAIITATFTLESYDVVAAQTVFTVNAPAVAKAKLSKVKNKAKKKAVVKWKRVAGASGYQVYYKSGKKAKTKTVSSSAKKLVLKKLKKGKKYTVKIRAFKTVLGQNFYGAWSSAKKVKIKK